MYYLCVDQVKKDDATYLETPVEISGDEDAIRKAKEIIGGLINPTTTVVNQMAGKCLSFGSDSLNQNM